MTYLKILKFTALITSFVFFYPSSAQETQEFSCISNYEKQVTTITELDRIPMEADEDETELKLTILSTGENVVAMNVENITSSSSTSYICFMRSNYPNLRNPPSTYSCASENTQLFFNSSSGVLFTFSPLTATGVGPDMFPLLKAKCTNSE